MNLQASTASAGPAGAAPSGRRVVDAPIRVFHGLLALAFVGAYVSADADSDHWRALHVSLGYTVAALLAMRLLYGIFGPRQARLVNLWRRLAGAPGWLRATFRPDVAAGHWRQGQNLAMALAVASLLALLPALTLAGHASFQRWGGEWLHSLHEGLAQVVLAVVLVHVGLLVAISWLRRQNQALPMLTGCVEGRGPDLVANDRGALAALLLVATLAFGAWTWQQVSTSPLVDDAAGHHGQRSGSADDDEDD